MGTTKSKDKDDGILGDGLAEMARKKLRSRQQQLDDILGEATGTPSPKPTTPEPKPTPKKNDKRERSTVEFL